jgi:hypothetical protein
MIFVYNINNNREEKYLNQPHQHHPDTPHPCPWIMVSWITTVMDMATVVEVREARDPRAVDIPMVISQASRTIPRRRTIIPPRVPRMVDMVAMTEGTVMMAAMDMTRRDPRMAAMAMYITDPRVRRTAVVIAMVDTVVMMAAMDMMVAMMMDITDPRGQRMAAVTAMVDMVVMMMMATMDMTRRAPRMMVAMMDITNPRGLRTVVTVMEDTVAVMMDMTPRVPRMVAAMEGMVTVMVDTELYELLPFKPREEREKSSPPSPTTS